MASDMNPQSDTRARYLKAAEAVNRGPSWLGDLRDRAQARFVEHGFPTARDEDWRYTNISTVERQPFLERARPTAITKDVLAPYLFSELDAVSLVFIDGIYAPTLSRLDRLAAGVTVTPLHAAVATHAEIVEAHLGQKASPEMNGFVALNTAAIADGAFIHLRAGITVEQPIHLVFVHSGQSDSTLVQPRNLFVVEAESTATVLEHYISVGEGRYLTNTVTEIYAARNAQFEHYRLQQESPKAYHINALHVAQTGSAEFTSHGIDLGGMLVRNDIGAGLDAEGASCTLNGLYVADGRQHVDNHTRIDHVKPKCRSREFYKGVLDGRARAVFTGRVVVHPQAQQTDAEQLNNNLLLSRDAEVDTKPQLEIYADDVKCSHGATVGQLDPDQLFYLQARAIDEATAKDLLTYAFANDVLVRLKLAPVRVALEHWLTRRLLHGRSLKELELV
jgi:Fe-S cluster assembly protein SufD